MNKWIISKSFDFCYAHRVHSQVLNSEYSIENTCACRFLHGHQGHINISLSSSSLTNGVVTDFKHLNWLKQWIDNVIDHKFIMDINDPLLLHEFPILGEPQEGRYLNLVRTSDAHTTDQYSIINPISYMGLPSFLREKYEGVIFVDFVPTSENLSKWLFEIVDNKMNGLGIEVVSVQFFETPKSQSIYTK